MHSMVLFVACRHRDLFVLRREKAIDIARSDITDIHFLARDRFEGGVLNIGSAGQREESSGAFDRSKETVYSYLLMPMAVMMRMPFFPTEKPIECAHAAASVCDCRPIAMWFSL